MKTAQTKTAEPYTLTLKPAGTKGPITEITLTLRQNPGDLGTLVLDDSRLVAPSPPLSRPIIIIKINNSEVKFIKVKPSLKVHCQAKINDSKATNEITATIVQGSVEVGIPNYDSLSGGEKLEKLYPGKNAITQISLGSETLAIQVKEKEEEKTRRLLFPDMQDEAGGNQLIWQMAPCPGAAGISPAQYVEDILKDLKGALQISPHPPVFLEEASGGSQAPEVYHVVTSKRGKVSLKTFLGPNVKLLFPSPIGRPAAKWTPASLTKEGSVYTFSSQPAADLLPGSPVPDPGAGEPETCTIVAGKENNDTTLQWKLNPDKTAYSAEIIDSQFICAGSTLGSANQDGYLWHYGQAALPESTKRTPVGWIRYRIGGEYRLEETLERNYVLPVWLSAPLTAAIKVTADQEWQAEVAPEVPVEGRSEAAPMVVVLNVQGGKLNSAEIKVSTPDPARTRITLTSPFFHVYHGKLADPRSLPPDKDPVPNLGTAALVFRNVTAPKNFPGLKLTFTNTGDQSITAGAEAVNLFTPALETLKTRQGELKTSALVAPRSLTGKNLQPPPPVEPASQPHLLAEPEEPGPPPPPEKPGPPPAPAPRDPNRNLIPVEVTGFSLEKDDRRTYLACTASKIPASRYILALLPWMERLIPQPQGKKLLSPPAIAVAGVVHHRNLILEEDEYKTAQADRPAGVEYAPDYQVTDQEFLKAVRDPYTAAWRDDDQPNTNTQVRHWFPGVTGAPTGISLGVNLTHDQPVPLINVYQNNRPLEGEGQHLKLVSEDEPTRPFLEFFARWKKGTRRPEVLFDEKTSDQNYEVKNSSLPLLFPETDLPTEAGQEAWPTLPPPSYDNLGVIRFPAQAKGDALVQTVWLYEETNYKEYTSLSMQRHLVKEGEDDNQTDIWFCCDGLKLAQDGILSQDPRWGHTGCYGFFAKPEENPGLQQVAKWPRLGGIPIFPVSLKKLKVNNTDASIETLEFTAVVPNPGEVARFLGGQGQQPQSEKAVPVFIQQAANSESVITVSLTKPDRGTSPSLMTVATVSGSVHWFFDPAMHRGGAALKAATPKETDHSAFVNGLEEISGCVTWDKKLDKRRLMIDFDGDKCPRLSIFGRSWKVAPKGLKLYGYGDQKNFRFETVDFSPDKKRLKISSELADWEYDLAPMLTVERSLKLTAAVKHSYDKEFRPITILELKADDDVPATPGQFLDRYYGFTLGEGKQGVLLLWCEEKRFDVARDPEIHWHRLQEDYLAEAEATLVVMGKTGRNEVRLRGSRLLLTSTSSGFGQADYLSWLLEGGDQLRLHIPTQKVDLKKTDQELTGHLSCGWYGAEFQGPVKLKLNFDPQPSFRLDTAIFQAKQGAQVSGELQTEGLHQVRFPGGAELEVRDFVWDGRTADFVRLGKLQEWVDADNYSGQTSVNSVAFSPDGKLRIIGKGNITSGKVEAIIWEGDRNPIKLTHAGYAIYAITVAQPGDEDYRIITGARDKQVRVWEGKGRSYQKKQQWSPGEVLSLAGSKDGQFLAAGINGGGLAVWHWEGRGKYQTYTVTNPPGRTKTINAVALSPSGMVLVAGGCCGAGPLQRTGGSIGWHRGDCPEKSCNPFLGLWVRQEADKLFGLEYSWTDLPLENIYTVAFWSPDGSLAEGSLLAVGFENLVKLWKLQGGQFIPFKGWEEKPPEPSSDSSVNKISVLALSPDGRTLVTGTSQEDHLDIWRLYPEAVKSPEKLRYRQECRGQSSQYARDCQAVSVAFSPDGCQLLVGSRLGGASLYNLSPLRLDRIPAEQLPVDICADAGLYRQLAPPSDETPRLVHCLGKGTRLQAIFQDDQTLFDRETTGLPFAPEPGSRWLLSPLVKHGDNSLHLVEEALWLSRAPSTTPNKFIWQTANLLLANRNTKLVGLYNQTEKKEKPKSEKSSKTGDPVENVAQQTQWSSPLIRRNFKDSENAVFRFMKPDVKQVQPVILKAREGAASLKQDQDVLEPLLLPPAVAARVQVSTADRYEFTDSRFLRQPLLPVQNPGDQPPPESPFRGQDLRSLTVQRRNIPVADSGLACQLFEATAFQKMLPLWHTPGPITPAASKARMFMPHNLELVYAPDKPGAMLHHKIQGQQDAFHLEVLTDCAIRDPQQIKLPEGAAIKIENAFFGDSAAPFTDIQRSVTVHWKEVLGQVTLEEGDKKLSEKITINCQKKDDSEHTLERLWFEEKFLAMVMVINQDVLEILDDAATLPLPPGYSPPMLYLITRVATLMESVKSTDVGNCASMPCKPWLVHKPATKKPLSDQPEPGYFYFDLKDTFSEPEKTQVKTDEGPQEFWIYKAKYGGDFKWETLQPNDQLAIIWAPEDDNDPKKPDDAYRISIWDREKQLKDYDEKNAKRIKRVGPSLVSPKVAVVHRQKGGLEQTLIYGDAAPPEQGFPILEWDKENKKILFKFMVKDQEEDLRLPITSPRDPSGDLYVVKYLINGQGLYDNYPKKHASVKLFPSHVAIESLSENGLELE